MPQPNPADIRVVVLAGGRGTRLAPLTVVFPKPLVPLGNRPIISILLSRLARFGFRKVTLCTGYLSELIMAVCGDGSQYGLDLDYAREEGPPLGTAAPLAGVPNLTDTFLVLNGDLLTTMNFRHALACHAEHRADVTIGIHPREVKIDLGVVDVDEAGRFTGFHEKPVYRFHVSMGVNILNRSVMRHVERGRYLDMPDLILKVHGSGGQVRCFSEDCFWLDIGRMDDYAVAQEEFARRESFFLGEDL